MACRAIRLAALSVVFALVAWAGVFAQNLDAGKTPAQLFSSTCSACHSTPRGLLKSVAAGQLPGFLRQHYTTGSEMAGTLAGYLVQNGAGVKVDTPTRPAPKAARKGQETPGATPGAPSATADAPAAPVPGKGKARQTVTVPTVDGVPAEGQPPAAKRQAKGKKGDDKRGPAVATPEPTPTPAPDAKPEAKPETVSAPEAKPEPKPEPAPTPLPVEAEHQATPPAAATPPASGTPAPESSGPVIVIVPRPEAAAPAASEGQAAPATPAAPSSETPAR